MHQPARSPEAAQAEPAARSSSSSSSASFAIIAMVALVIEGGNLFAQQRIAQNGSDSASTAGAIIVAEKLSGKTRTDQDVFNAVKNSADANELAATTPMYTDDTGNPIGADVQNIAQPIPIAARGVQVGGDRTAGTTFARILGIDSLTASADATVVAGPLSLQCVADDDGCTLLPLTFPVKVFECDGKGELLPNGQWIGAPPPAGRRLGLLAIVGAEDLPGGSNPGPTATRRTGTRAPRRSCRCARAPASRRARSAGSTSSPGMNLADEITGPLNTTLDLPDWFQTQAGNPNSVEDELMEYWHTARAHPALQPGVSRGPGEHRPVQQARRSTRWATTPGITSTRWACSTSTR